MSKIYYQDRGLCVDEVMITTAAGDMFPLENMSSVRIVRHQNRMAILFSLSFIAMGFVLPIIAYAGLFMALIAYGCRNTSILVGDGSAENVAVQVPAWFPKDKARVEEITAAINMAIRGRGWEAGVDAHQ